MNFIVPGMPTSKGRPQFTKSGHAHTPKRTVIYETRVMMMAKQAQMPLLDGPVQVVVNAWWEWPKHKWRKREPRECEWKENGADGDNILKAVLDGCQGICFRNDAQVAMATVTKRYCAQGEAARVEVYVGPLEESA